MSYKKTSAVVQQQKPSVKPCMQRNKLQHKFMTGSTAYKDKHIGTTGVHASVSYYIVHAGNNKTCTAG